MLQVPTICIVQHQPRPPFHEHYASRIKSATHFSSSEILFIACNSQVAAKVGSAFIGDKVFIHNVQESNNARTQGAIFMCFYIYWNNDQVTGLHCDSVDTNSKALLCVHYGVSLANVDLLQQSKGVSVSKESMCLFFYNSRHRNIKHNQIVADCTYTFEPGMF